MAAATVRTLRGTEPQKEKEKTFDELKMKMLIHGRLVEKLDLTRLGNLEGDGLRREIRRPRSTT